MKMGVFSKFARANLKRWQTFGWFLPDDQKELVNAAVIEATKTDNAIGVKVESLEDSGPKASTRFKQRVATENALERFRKKAKFSSAAPSSVPKASV